MGLGVDIDSMVYGDLDNDAELEAELRALQEEDSGIRSGRNQGSFGGVKGWYTTLCCSYKTLCIYTVASRYYTKLNPDQIG